MTNLDQQLQELMNTAPQYGVPSIVMEKAVIPILKQLALPLKYPQYYLLTASDQSWIITTLSHRQYPEQEKKVIYAFGSPKEAKTRSQSLNIISLPVTHLLFELLTIPEIDSIIFIEDSDNLNKGKEIKQKNLYQMIQEQIKQFKDSSQSFYA